MYCLFGTIFVKGFEKKDKMGGQQNLIFPSAHFFVSNIGFNLFCAFHAGKNHSD